MRRFVYLAWITLVALPSAASSQTSERPRARDIGIVVGVFEPGEHNAITDVAGVRVGHTTVIDPPNVRTGITAILPHGGNPYQSRVPAAIHVGNGYGKLIGYTQVQELGELESPILLTCTLCVWRAADATASWMLERDGMESVRSLNVVVGETNDGTLNDIRARAITPQHVFAALESADGGPVQEGAVGAGAGTRAFGWKAGIGTSSRLIPEAVGGYTVGVMVQLNLGSGVLQMGGAPLGVELGQYTFSQFREDDASGRQPAQQPTDEEPGGSIMVVVATDAPLSHRNLGRVASRAVMGISRTGGFGHNGTGDYVIAFSTANEVRRSTSRAIRSFDDLPNGRMDPLFQATVEATEEAIYNALLKAETVTSNGRTSEALPLAETIEILTRYGVIP